MGVADIIPGVRWNCRLLLGIYDQLIKQVSTASSAIGSLIRGDVEDASNGSGPSNGLPRESFTGHSHGVAAPSLMASNPDS